LAAGPNYGCELSAAGRRPLARSVSRAVYMGWLIDWRALIAHADAVAIAEGLDSTVNLLLLAFGAIWFVLTLEQRLKRPARDEASSSNFVPSHMS